MIPEVPPIASPPLAAARGAPARLAALPRGRARLLSVEHAVAAAALGVAAALWWPVLAPPEPRTSPSPPPAWGRDLALANLDEKPLFNAARRFPPAPAAPPDSFAELPARPLDAAHSVKGFGRTEGDAIALVENRETRRVAVLRVGGVVEGYSVTAIGAGEVVLQGPDGGSVTLRREGGPPSPALRP